MPKARSQQQKTRRARPWTRKKKRYGWGELFLGVLVIVVLVDGSMKGDRL
jgi:hypothetical protein